MFSKMKYSVFLSLQLFMLTTSFPDRIWLINDEFDSEELSYDPNTPLDQKQVYVFTMTESHYVSVIYVVGAQSEPHRKVEAGKFAAGILQELYETELKGTKNLYFRRITSDSTINSFADIRKWERVFQENPRFYSVTSDGISQIPLKTNLQEHGKAFVLHNESEIIVYYSPLLDQNIRKKAVAFASYIRDFEKEKHNVDTSLRTLRGKIHPNVALNTLVDRIKEIMEISSKIKINSIQENDAENFRTINNACEDKNFEIIKKTVYDSLNGTGLIVETNTENCTTSTSSDSTSKGRKNKAHKKITKGRRNKNEPSNVDTIAASTTSTYVFKSSILTISAPEKRLSNWKELPSSVKSFCVHLILDIENKELLIYFGREAEKSEYIAAIMIAEVVLDNHPSMNVSYIADDGNLLLPSFIIQFKDELEDILSKYPSEKQRSKN